MSPPSRVGAFRVAREAWEGVPGEVGAHVIGQESQTWNVTFGRCPKARLLVECVQPLGGSYEHFVTRDPLR